MVHSIASILQYCLRKSPAPVNRRALRARTPQIEPLESRVLLSGITLANPVYVATGTQLQFRQFADFNGDDSPDMLLSGPGQLAIWTNDGHGKFAPYSTYSLGSCTPGDLLVGDFTGDGKPDIVCGQTLSATPICLLVNLGNGTTTASAN
jgi:hypothetical protein